MGLSQISFKGPWRGYPPIKASESNYGMESGARQQEAVVFGMAAAWKSSSDPADNLSYYLFGHASAQPEFAGIVASVGNAPTLAIPVCTTDSEVTQICYAGICPALLAPGETVKRGDYVEPIPAGLNRAMFRKAPCGPVQAMQSADNSGGTVGMLISGIVIPDCQGSGLVGAVGPSDELTTVTVETVYKIGTAPVVVDLAADSFRVGDRYRINFGITAGSTSGGAYVVKLYADGIGSSALATMSRTLAGTGDVFQGQVDLYIKALSGANNVAVSGSVAAGAPGTVTYTAVAGTASMDLTAINSISLAATPNAGGDKTTLQYLSVEKL